MGFAPRISLFFFMIVLLPRAIHSQGLVCPSPYVYMDGGQFIKFYDPNQPLSATNPSNTNIPTFGSGLALMPNINGGTICPTFYSVSGGTYWYWDGTTWINTNHSTGNSAAVNLGGCGSYLYNIVGGTGQIYVYDGTGNGSLLTTLQGFNGGGPYDLVTDCNCNFYALNTTTSSPGQSLTKYSPTGVPTQSWSLVNMPNASAGGGFAIIGNMLYLKNNLTNGFFIGTIGQSSVTFTQVTGFTASPGDFASCPICTTSPAPLSATVTGGILTCTQPTLNLVVLTQASPVTFSWSGPGIVGPANGSVITVNSQGPYSVVVKGYGCPASSATLYTSVYTNTNVVSAVISPSGNICSSTTGPTTLSVAHNSTTEVVSWSGTGIVNAPGADTLVVPGPGFFTVTVTNPQNGCYKRDFVSIVQTPTVSLSLSANSVCALPLNGSPTALTITASGAPSYTLFTDPTFTVPNPNATVNPVSILNTQGGTASATLIGANAFCSDTTYASFQIIPNPVISAPAGNVCPGESFTFQASGANTFTWTNSSQPAVVSPTLQVAPVATSVFTLVGSAAGCRSSNHTTTVTVKPVPQITVTPSTSTICLGSTIGLSVIGSANVFTWTPPFSISNPTAQSIIANPSANQTYSVLGALNGCTNTAVAQVYVVPPPVVTLSLSSASMCYTNYFGSPNSLTIIPSGALSYTMLPNPSYIISFPTGPQMVLTAAGPSPAGIVQANVAVISTSGVCTVTNTATVDIIPNPVVTITPPTASICPGQSQVYTATGASNYTWQSSPNVVQMSSSVIAAQPPVTSFYSVRGSSLGCNSDIRNAVLVVLPVPSVTVSPVTATVCAGNTIQLVADGSGQTYSWSPGATLSSLTGKTVTAKPSGVTVYSVVSTFNTCTNVAIATVSAIPIPSITIDATETVVCSGSPARLKASGAQSYNWTPPQTVNLPSAAAVIVSPIEPTTYTVNGFNGVCTGTSQVFIQTVPHPRLKIGAVNNQNEICFGSSLTMTVSGAQQYSWQPSQWAFPPLSSTVVLLKPPVNTNFTVSGINSMGTVSCYQQVSYSVLVVPVIQAVVSPQATLCAGEKITLSGTGGNMTRWSPADGLNSTEGTRVVAGPTVSTVYTVEISNAGYCAVTTTVGVTVLPRPSIFAGRDTSYNVNEPIFIAAVASGPVSWTSGDGIACRDCAITQVYPSRNSCYVAETINEYGCTAADQVCLVIREDFSVFVPNSFTPNGDGLNDVFLIFGENISNIRLEIFDRWGELLYVSDDQLKGWDGTYHGTTCKPDVYTYRLRYQGLDRKTYERSGRVQVVR